MLAHQNVLYQVFFLYSVLRRTEKQQNHSTMDIYLLQSLCKSICRKEGRDSLLQYVIEAIESVEEQNNDDIDIVVSEETTSPQEE